MIELCKYEEALLANSVVRQLILSRYSRSVHLALMPDTSTNIHTHTACKYSEKWHATLIQSS